MLAVGMDAQTLLIPLMYVFCETQICCRLFMLFKELQNHVNVHALYQSTCNLANCAEVLVACYLCGKGFKNSQQIQAHVEIEHLLHTPLPNTNQFINLPYIDFKRYFNSEDTPDVDEEESRKFRCDVLGCGRTFKRSGHLKRHKLVHVPQTERRRFYCESEGCDKNYSTKYDLTAHYRQSHQGYRLYKCIYRGCCRRFVRKESLDKHLSSFDHESLSNLSENEYNLENIHEYKDMEYSYDMNPEGIHNDMSRIGDFGIYVNEK